MSEPTLKILMPSLSSAGVRNKVEHLLMYLPGLHRWKTCPDLPPGRLFTPLLFQILPELVAYRQRTRPIR